MVGIQIPTVLIMVPFWLVIAILILFAFDKQISAKMKRPMHDTAPDWGIGNICTWGILFVPSKISSKKLYFRIEPSKTGSFYQ